MRKLGNKTVRVAVMLPEELRERLIRQSAKETADRVKAITPSQILRWALEEYLDTWETAQAVKTEEAK